MFSNWQNELTIYGIEVVEKKLQDANRHIRNNPNVKQAYQDALDSVLKTREVITRFVATYNQEYKSKNEEEV